MTEPADDAVTLPRRLVDEVVAEWNNNPLVAATMQDHGMCSALAPISNAITRLAAALPPEPRAPGWYWVRLWPGAPWGPSRCNADGIWPDCDYDEVPAVIGPRIEEPGE